MRSMAITRKTPTPTATAPTSTALGTPGTCSASTCRSGSDTVTMTPIRKPTITTTHSFRERVMAAPTRSPMGVMAVSAPRENRAMPRITITAPIRKASSVSVGMGAAVKLRTSTITMMGTTEASASRSFSHRTVLLRPRRSRHCFRLFHGNLITSQKFRKLSHLSTSYHKSRRKR